MSLTHHCPEQIDRTKERVLPLGSPFFALRREQRLPAPFGGGAKNIRVGSCKNFYKLYHDIP